MQISTRSLFRTAAAVALLAAPTVAAAQQTLKPVQVVADRLARAEQLEAEAAALPTEIAKFGKAARLYERAAESRPMDDAKTAHALRCAAFYRYYSGDSFASLRLLERAAESSLLLGDLVSATTSYIDAAFVADELRQGDRSSDFAQRADRLTRSPLLDQSQRDALRMRIAGPRTVALLAP